MIWGRGIFGYFLDVGWMDIYRFTDIFRCEIKWAFGIFSDGAYQVCNPIHLTDSVRQIMWDRRRREGLDVWLN